MKIYTILFLHQEVLGKPKGVKITYNDLNSFINWFRTCVIPCNKSIILNQAAFSFDLSVADLYLALVTKSKLIVLNKSIQMDFLNLFELLKASNIEIAVMTPTFAEILLMDKSFNNELLPNLKTIYFCGEILSIKTAKELLSRFNETEIINSYGPTECTVAVTFVKVDNELIKKEILPIADFKLYKQNANIYIVDDNLKEVKEGEIGEILICGDSVADGYLNVPNNKFIVFNKEKGYLTGDLGYIKNSKLYYKERKDRQIKYKGYRIELSDIEQNVEKLDEIEKCKVIPKTIDNKVVKIIAFVKLKNSYNANAMELQKKLKKYLPDYMCPKIKVLEEFPINNNGKIDIERLKQITNGREN